MWGFLVSKSSSSAVGYLLLRFVQLLEELALHLMLGPCIDLIRYKNRKSQSN
jgi:hypothetical protein